MSTPATRLEVEPADAADGDPWSLLLAGDVVIECDSDASLRSDGLVAGSLGGRIAGADLALTNLEAPVRSSAPPIDKSGPSLSCHADTPAALARSGFDAVTLANNHAMDHGEGGLDATLAACRDAGIGTVGAGPDRQRAMAPLVRTVGDVELAVFSVCEREFGVADEEVAGTAWEAHPSASDRIATAAERHDAVVVVSHGGIEAVPFPPPGRQRRLRAFVEAGADAVIGHHPHVPQGWERHDGAPICYSLGNFHFERWRSRAPWGLVAELEFAGETVTGVELVPVALTEGTVSRAARSGEGYHRLAHLERLAERTADADRLSAHWQEVADRVFLASHARTLRQATGSSLLSVLDSPAAFLRQDGIWDGQRRRSELLALLNLTRNESHRELVQTALALRTGEATDRRTPTTRRETRELLERTSHLSLYDRPHDARLLAGLLAAKLGRVSRAGLGRLAGALPSRS